MSLTVAFFVRDCGSGVVAGENQLYGCRRRKALHEMTGAFK